MKKKYILKRGKPLNILFVCFIILLSYTSMAQNLIFTIDTAVDNGTSVTETIMQGGDAYVLDILHPGDEEFDILSGSDQVVFIGNTAYDSPYVISLTKNGTPFSFTFNSLDYDTLEEGHISIENQDDDVITPNTLYALGAGTITPTNATNALNVSSFKITPNDVNGSLELNDFAFHNFDITVGSTLSNNNFELNQEISVYPNPSYGNVTIKNSSVALESAIITDLNGRVVANFNLNSIKENKELNLNHLTSGLYLVNITSNEGSTVKKLIIK